MNLIVDTLMRLIEEDVQKDEKAWAARYWPGVRRRLVDSRAGELAKALYALATRELDQRDRPKRKGRKEKP